MACTSFAFVCYLERRTRYCSHLRSAVVSGAGLGSGGGVPMIYRSCKSMFGKRHFLENVRQSELLLLK